MSQNDIEERISIAAKSITNKIVYPEREFGIVNQESKKYRRIHNTFKRVILVASVFVIIVTLSGITVAGISGTNVIDYFFGNPAFKEVQEKDLVTTANMVAEKDGIKVELKAIFCDSDTTYLTLTADGAAFDAIKPKRVINGEEWGNRVINRIKEVYVENENGFYWQYTDKMNKKNENGWSYGESSLNDGSKNGALLIFYAAPKESTTVNIKIQFENGTEIEFKQIELKVIPIQHRDLSEQNYYIEYPGTVGHITEIIYSAYKATIVVEWATKSVAEEDRSKYDEEFKTHTQQALINGKEYYIGDYGFYANYIGIRTDSPKSSTETYDIVGTQATPQDTIEIRVYNKNPNGTIGTLDYVWLTIPGESK